MKTTKYPPRKQAWRTNTKPTELELRIDADVALAKMDNLATELDILVRQQGEPFVEQCEGGENA